MVVPPADAINSVCPDLEQADYVISMIEEEVGPTTSFEELWDLIGDFLDEQYGSVAGREHCAALLKLLKPETRGEDAAGGSSSSTSPSSGGGVPKAAAKGPLSKMLGVEEYSAGTGFSDEFMGLDTKTNNYNEVVQIGDVVAKRRAQNTKDRAAAMLRMKQWQNQKVGSV